MKPLNILKKSIGFGLLAAAFAFAGCSMTLDSDTVNESIKDVTGLLNRSAIEKMTFMGGSMLYSPEEESTNQLYKGVKIGLRVGQVIKTDIGGGNIVYQNSKTDCFYGYMSINDVSKEKITFTLYVMPDDQSYQTAEEKGIFSINAGEGYDITGDGVADLSWTKPAAGRKGQKKNMWLNFISNMTDGSTTTMFSVIPMQYARSVYPGGLMGINTNGQYIINKYDVGTSNRAAISSISKGDFVFDCEQNTISKYVGDGINGKRNSRALEDSELKVEEELGNETTVEDVLFTGSEFIDEFSIYALLSSLPSTIVKETFEGRSIAENIAYLNTLIQQTDFLDNLLAANSGDAVDEIKNQLSQQAISGTLEMVLINRHSLALIYPDKCPDVNLSSGTLASALPWLFVDLGDVVTQAEVETAARSNISDQKKAEAQSSIDAKNAIYLAQAKEKHKREKGIYRDEYIDYEIKRDVLISRFGELKSFNVAPFLSNLTGVQAIRDIVEGTNATISLGVGGSISFSNGDPAVKLKLAVLLKCELEDRLKVGLSSTSIFASANPVTKSPDDYMKEFKEKYPNSNFAESDMKYFFNNYSEDSVKHNLGLDNWYCNFTSANQQLTKNGIIKPSDDAKTIHKAVQPISGLPVVVTFDASFDILLKLKLMVEFKDCYIGGIALYGVDCGAGVNWGFRKKFLGIPLLWTFYCDTYDYAIKISEAAGYAGYKKNDTSGVQIGGGLQFVVCPVLQFRAGIGIGADIAVVSADFTIGAWADCYLPIGLYLGLNLDLDKKPIFVSEATMDFGAAWGVDLQVYLKPVVISGKKWTYPIYQDQFFAANIYTIRFENFKCVKGASTIASTFATKSSSSGSSGSGSGGSSIYRYYGPFRFIDGGRAGCRYYY